eukprot:TRINITY_DN6382_c0_g1_i1.p1 TRINITY_DN6382_c0_g1~~TRINITY_DN6382_c0_g1_i1.p1  ORF type:complete len:327 (-),score=52.65 TRINITY_DN6382_c0_g1_i1:90-1070(-)
MGGDVGGAVLGGVLVGVGTSINYALAGRLTNNFKIMSRILTCKSSWSLYWKSCYMLVLIFVGCLFFLTDKKGFDDAGEIGKMGALGWIIAGFLVGFGAKLAGGCSTYHGICGIPLFNIPSALGFLVMLLAGAGMTVLKKKMQKVLDIAKIDKAGLEPETLAKFMAVVAAVLIVLILILTICKEKDRYKTRHIIVAVASGAFYASGSVLGTKTKKSANEKMLSFFDGFEPTVLYVYLVAMAVNVIVFNLVRRNSMTTLVGVGHREPKWRDHYPWRLFVGALCFGLGWGLSGLTPGPTMIVFGLYFPHVMIIYVALIIGGYFLAKFLD